MSFACRNSAGKIRYRQSSFFCQRSAKHCVVFKKEKIQERSRPQYFTNFRMDQKRQIFLQTPIRILAHNDLRGPDRVPDDTKFDQKNTPYRTPPKGKYNAPLFDRFSGFRHKSRR